LFLLAQGKAGVSFKLKEITKEHVVFENPSHDFPRTITYELKNADTLVLRVEGKKDGFPPVIETQYRRLSR
jgi:hypothetical protein